MHAVGVPVLLCSSVISLRERNKKRHGKARTSSKGERGSKGKDKQKARKLTHFIRRCVLRVTEQSTTSRIAKQTSQIASSAVRLVWRARSAGLRQRHCPGVAAVEDRILSRGTRRSRVGGELRARRFAQGSTTPFRRPTPKSSAVLPQTNHPSATS